MRRIPLLILLGFLLIALAPTPGRSQFQGKSKGNGTAPPATGSAPSGGATTPGSGGSSGGRGGMFGDPSKLFDMMSGGKDIVTRDTLPNPLLAGMFDRFAEKMGVTDGKITREQFNHYLEQKSATGGTGSPGAPTGSTGNGPPPWAKGGERGGGGDQAEMMDRWADSMFRRYDGNGDGLLNYDEMPENLRIERDKFDENKDGFIDLTEYKNFFKATVMQRMAEGREFNPPPMAKPGAPVEDPDDDEDHPPKAVVYRAGKLPKEMPAWFKTCDADGDGQVTMLEWRTAGRSLEEFQRLDRNGDGFVTIAEVMYSVQGKNNYNGVAVATSNPAAPTEAKPATESRGGGFGGMFGKGGSGSSDTKGGFGRFGSTDSKGGSADPSKGSSETGKGGFGKGGFGKR